MKKTKNYIALKDIATITMGLSPKGTSYNNIGDGLPLLNGPTEFEANHPSCTLYTTDSKRKCEVGDLLFCVRGSTTGRMNWADQVYSLGRGVCSFHGKDQALTRFVKYSLDLTLEALLALSGGSTFPNLNKDDIRKFEVPFSQDYKKIVGILSAYDDLIENNNKRIALLEKAAEDIYREWFVRMRFPGWDKVKFVKGVPEGWEYKPMRELIEFHIGGGWGEEKSSIDFSEGAYVIRGTDLPSINSGDFSKDVYRYHKPSNYKSRKLKSGDIVFEVAGGSTDQWLGRSALITDDVLAYFEETVICASFCKLIRFDKNIVSPYFMKYFLKLYYSTGLVGTFQVQSTGISNYQFESFLSGQQVLLPIDNLIKTFDEKVLPLIKLKDKLSLANIKLKGTRDLLLARLISGRLPVEGLDIRFPPSMVEDSAG